MALEIPKIDRRDYRQIFTEALARIPVHNPEWTNFNHSDPGVTLIQLFAFMTENLLYRSNLIPERNRIKFLKLLGVPVQPASAASGIVTFSHLKGPLQTETLPADLEVQAGQVPFRTREGIDVLPIEAKVYYKKTLTEEEVSEGTKNLYLQLYPGSPGQGAGMKYYETTLLEAPGSGVDFSIVDLSDPGDTVDGSLWVALLARPSADLEKTRDAIGNKELTLGILPALTEAEGQVLAAGPAAAETQPELSFHMPIYEKFDPENENPRARYRALTPRTSAKLLSEPGVVHLSLPGKSELKLWDNLEPAVAGTGDFPPSLEETDIQERLITWVRIRVSGKQEQKQKQEQEPAQEQGGEGSTGFNRLKARLSWVGINAANVRQYAHVSSETPGTGTGEPDQSFTLANIPVLADSVKLTVNNEEWQSIDDLMTAGPEVPVRGFRQIPSVPQSSTDPAKAKVFTVDRESGEIRFGDGAHGARPPRGAVIRAQYDYGGGTQGNVGTGAINKSPALANGIKVTNEIPAWGGDEAETTTGAEKNIAAYLRHRDRLVSMDDFKEITQRTPGIELGRVEVLPLFHPDVSPRDILSPGVVTLLVIPANDLIYPDTPEPDLLFLDGVCDYLEPRRLVTTELHVRGPEYVELWVSVGIDVVPGMDIPAVREAVKKEIKKFLSALAGGFDGKGWPLEKTVDKLELWARATQVEGVSRVNGVLLAKGEDPAVERVEMKGLQLPRIMGLAVQGGESESLEQVRADSGYPTGEGEETAGAETAAAVFPVPVVPEECK